MNLLDAIKQHFSPTLAGMVPDPAPYVGMVKAAQDPRHGDYQANAAMSLAKELGQKPRDIAQEIVRRLPAGDMLLPPEIAGPGFINFRLQPEWLARQIQVMAKDPRLGIPGSESARSFVLDFSSPNVAKPMHVRLAHPFAALLGASSDH